MSRKESLQNYLQEQSVNHLKHRKLSVPEISQIPHVDQLNLKDWIESQPLPIELEGSPKPIIKLMSIKKVTRRKFSKRHKSIIGIQNQESGIQTEISPRTNGSKDTVNDPLPNIKFTKRKMRLDIVNMKSKQDESQVYSVLSPRGISVDSPVLNHKDSREKF